MADFKETHTRSHVDTAEDPELKQLVIVKKNYLLRTTSGAILKHVSCTLSADKCVMWQIWFIRLSSVYYQLNQLVEDKLVLKLFNKEIIFFNCL